MSCQQASRFITTAGTTTNTITTNSVIKRIVTATQTLSSSVESAAVKTTSTPEDPYVFTETVSATPPILFNAQKSRARLSEVHLNKINNNNNNINYNNNNSNNNNNNNRTTVTVNTKPNIVSTTATAPLAQLNGTTIIAGTAAATAAAAKTQASLAALGEETATAATATTITTNFNNATQSSLQLQSQPKAAPQTSPKRATNVCIVRPQQQQVKKQQQQQEKQLVAVPPPPLYTHTPSLWQTPLILDTGSANATQKQAQQLAQHPPPLSPVSSAPPLALVSPPTSPASLPSPTAATSPTATVTAMVAPLVVPASPPKATIAGQPLPPSKFHHNTLAQHLQKVECLKKKKSLPLMCNNNNNNNIAEPFNKTAISFNATQPPPLTVFNTEASAPLTRLATAPQKHSATAAPTASDDTDLSDIPVNVIFRKPPALGTAGPIEPGGQLQSYQNLRSVNAVSQAMNHGPVCLLTPPTPPTPPLLANHFPQPPPQSSAMRPTPILTSTPALNAKAVHTQTGIFPSLALTLPSPKTCTQKEQTSSKVANTTAVAVPKRKTNATACGSRKGNKTAVAKKNAALQATDILALPPPSLSSQPQQVLPKAGIALSQLPVSKAKQQRWKQQYKITALETESEPDFKDIAYTLQKQWLEPSKDHGMESPTSLSNRREERIAVRKGLLRRQALQLLSIRPLQELPMRVARQRVNCVQNLLLKYKGHLVDQTISGGSNRCLVPACTELTLTMAAHCERHIVNNTTQQIFMPCAAKRSDGLLCQTPVFDMLHTLPLCAAHSHLRTGMEVLGQQQRQQLVQQQQRPPLVQLPQHPQPMQQIVRKSPVPAVPGKRTTNPPASRKRKTNPNANPVGRPQKRPKKQMEQKISAAVPPVAVHPSHVMTALPPMSSVLQRKSSTTSLESIASNSHSSGPQLPYTPQPNVSQQNLNQQLSILPALAPLSDHSDNFAHNLSKLEAEQLDANQLLGSNVNVNLLANANFKADEINQIVAELTAASGDVNHNNNSTHYNNNINYNNVGFPSFNAAFGNAVGHNGSTGGGIGNNVGGLNMAHTQDMFGICENSSAYASSEDTGLGGLSESELMGANDTDDIALNGAHLLEEHDLVNVFDTLPDDAFNELFQSVQQAECEAMDRALEIADKNLKCLQQTIGGSDGAFLNDFLDVGDDLLANAVSSVMNSPNTSGIDTSTLFVDSNGGGNSSSNSAIGTSGSNGCTPPATVADIRGLVQT